MGRAFALLLLAGCSTDPGTTVQVTSQLVEGACAARRARLAGRASRRRKAGATRLDDIHEPAAKADLPGLEGEGADDRVEDRGAGDAAAVDDRL